MQDYRLTKTAAAAADCDVGLAPAALTMHSFCCRPDFAKCDPCPKLHHVVCPQNLCLLSLKTFDALPHSENSCLRHPTWCPDQQGVASCLFDAVLQAS